MKKSRKAKIRLALRIKQYEKALSMRNKSPEAYTRPGSLKCK